MHASLIERMKKENYRLVSIDLFSGPGGICTGFKWAGILPLIAVEWTNTTVETYSLSHDAEVFELSKYIINSKKRDEEYLKKFLKESTKTILIHGDINKVKITLIKRLLLERYGIDSKKETVDVVSGGAPCESFSLAGKRNEGDSRDDLFSNILRIARAVKTKLIMFENVKGLLSKPRDGVKGAIFNDICDAFEQCAYKLVSRKQSDILLTASDYGVPQNRERLILIALRKEIKNLTFSYPSKTHGEGKKHPYVTVDDAISDLPAVGSGEVITKYIEPQNFISENQKHFLEIIRGNYESSEMHALTPEHLIKEKLFDSQKINNQNGPGHIERKRQLLALIPERESMRSVFERMTNDGTIDQYRHLFPKTIYGSRNRRLLADEPSFTVTSHCLDEILHPSQNRAITVREAARLQSFPDWYQFAGPDVTFHSDIEEDKYEQIGDAVPPLLAYALGKEIVKSLPSHI